MLFEQIKKALKFIHQFQYRFRKLVSWRHRSGTGHHVLNVTSEKENYRVIYKKHPINHKSVLINIVFFQIKCLLFI